VKPIRLAVLALACLMALACSKTSGGAGVPAAGPGSNASTTTSTTTSTTSSSTPTPALSEPGVVTTLPDTIPPDALLCLPSPTDGGTATHAQVVDPVAPRIVVNVPKDWTSTPGHADVALTLRGPDGMSGTVKIALTALDPAAAFKHYSDELMNAAPMVSENVRPAEFCGYSSQIQYGTMSGSGPTVEFSDRIAHIWTNTTRYLVSIHAQAPKATPGFEPAKKVLMDHFSVVIP
jgi:hypothetical protein